MNSFLLRVEGVNLANYVYDTQDLSTIRGGGLQLLDAAKKVQDFLSQMGCSTRSIIEAASIGLFHVESARSPEEVHRSLAARLADWLPHATFTVDIDSTHADFPIRRAALTARNRWRQMQAPTVVYPPLKGVREQDKVCEIDMVRPGKQVQNAPDRKKIQSESVRSRREFGRAQKQSFYLAEMSRVGPPDPPDYQYTLDFEDLCENSDEWGNLRDKMAVLYLDGNRFGEFAREYCRTEDSQRDFSQGLRNEQARILRKLIETLITPDPTWRNAHAENRVRLETLLWGGDEILWVVPAWKGWELLRFFFEECSTRPTPPWSPSPDAMTYSAGLVFCHSKAPIHTIRKLAKDLAEKVKHRNKNEGNAYQNRFLYQVLESFDHIGAVDDSYLPLVLPGPSSQEISNKMPALREQVSRKKLHRMMKEPSVATEVASEIKKELRSARATEALAGIEELENVASDRVWHHIAELWDYAVPERIDI